MEKKPYGERDRHEIKGYNSRKCIDLSKSLYLMSNKFEISEKRFGFSRAQINLIDMQELIDLCTSRPSNSPYT